MSQWPACDRLGGAPSGLLRANPTGHDLEPKDWEEVADVLAEREIIPLIDLAYQSLGNGLEEDATECAPWNGN